MYSFIVLHPFPQPLDLVCPLLRHGVLDLKLDLHLKVRVI